MLSVYNIIWLTIWAALLSIVSSNETDGSQKLKNVIIFTDSEPDDLLALVIVALYNKDAIKFIAVHMNDAVFYAGKIRRLLDAFGLQDIEVIEGPDNEEDADKLKIPSAKHALKFAVIEKMDWEKSFYSTTHPRSEEEALEGKHNLKQETEAILMQEDHNKKRSVGGHTFQPPQVITNAHRGDNQERRKHLSDRVIQELTKDEKTTFILLSTATELQVSLERDPKLSEKVHMVYAMGGWSSRRLSTYNWNLDIKSAKWLMEESQLPVKLISSHTLSKKELKSINRINFKKLYEFFNKHKEHPGIKMLLSSAVGWSKYIKSNLKELEGLIEKVGVDQFCGADPVTVLVAILDHENQNNLYKYEGVEVKINETLEIANNYSRKYLKQQDIKNDIPDGYYVENSPSSKLIKLLAHDYDVEKLDEKMADIFEKALSK